MYQEISFVVHDLYRFILVVDLLFMTDCTRHIGIMKTL